MSDELARLFEDFDRGRLSRRRLLQTLGLAAAAAPVAAMARPASVLAYGQGTCGGTNVGTPRCNTTPGKAPFEPTGWTTVLLDHFSMQVADYEKEAAYFAALMNWKVRSDDGTSAVLDIGDNVGGVVIRGGFPVPPPAPPQPPPAAGAAGRGGRGGARAPRLFVVDGFAWGIAPWDAKKVEAELRKRGLSPVADNAGKDVQSFHVKDPDGFDLQITNGSLKNRRHDPAKGKTSAPAPFESTAWKTVWLDHISFQASNYKESVAFYSALLGWTPGDDEGSQSECQIGDVGNIIIRGGNPYDPNFGRSRGRGGAAPAPADAAAPPAAPPARHAMIDHIAFGIQPWDADAVKAELDKRGLTNRADTGGKGDIHTASYQSYHTTTPNGFDLQISNGTRASRNTR